MSGLNKMTLIGHVVKDPELKYTATGRAMCDLRICTVEEYKGKDGNRVKAKEYHRVVAWAGQAEICAKFLTKGRLVYIEGPLQTRSWDKDGQKHYVTEVRALNIVFLDSRSGAEDGEIDEDRHPAGLGAPAPSPPRQGGLPGIPMAADDDSDIPF